MKFQGIYEELDRYIEEALFYEDLPGIAVGAGGIGAGDGFGSCGDYEGLEYKKAAGYKDYSTFEKLRTSDVFHMCSVSKLFVGSAILMLQERGQLSIEQTLDQLLSTLPFEDQRWHNVKIIHMLTHTSGLWDVSDYLWNAPRTDENALRDYVWEESAEKKQLLWMPGQGGFQYSNFAYEILGLIVAEISGMSFEAFVEENIFKTLGMKDSSFLTFDRILREPRSESGNDAEDNDRRRLLGLSAAGLAMPHKKDEEKHIILEDFYPYNRAHGPSSTLTSNIYDMGRWAEAHLSMSLFSRESYQKMWTAYGIVPNNGERIGLSWFLREQKGEILYGHEGRDDGFRSSFWICPNLGLHITVCSNLTKAPVKKISKKIFDIITN